MIIIRMVLFAFFFFYMKGMIAQSTIDHYVDKALAENLALRQLSFDYEQSEQDVKVAKSAYLPKVSFESRYTLAAGGRSIDLPLGDLLNPVYGALNQLTNSQNFPMLENQSEQFLPNNFQENYLSVEQPLFNSDIHFGYKARQEQARASAAQRLAYQNQLKKEVKTACYKYLSAQEAIHIYEEALQVLREADRLNQVLYKNDKITYEKVLNVQAEQQTLQQQLFEAESQQVMAQSYLNYLLNDSLQSPVSLDTTELQSINYQLDSLAALQQQALQARDEFKQLDAAVAANKQLAKLHQYSYQLPKAFVGAQAGFQGFGYSFDAQQDYALVQVGMSWNIFQGGKQKALKEKYELKAQQIQEQTQQVAQQIKLETQQAFEQLKTALQAYQSAKVELKALEEALRITQKKYEYNKVIQLEYLTAQQKYVQTKIQLNVLKYNILIQQAALDAAIKR